jgi:hypothetical protein
MTDAHSGATMFKNNKASVMTSLQQFTKDFLKKPHIGFNPGDLSYLGHLVVGIEWYWNGLATTFVW